MSAEALFGSDQRGTGRVRRHPVDRRHAARRWWRCETGCAGRRRAPGFRTFRGRFSGSGLTQAEYPFVAASLTAVLTIAFAWGLRHVAAGRAVYATGSNPDAARLAGLDTAAVKCAVFAIVGTLTGLAAVLNAVRFNQIPSNAGIGLEMKVIASVVVGGASRRRRRGGVPGTVLGVILLAAIGSCAHVPAGISALGARHPGRDHPRRDRG